ncbi:flagellar hook-associated protein FlgL [Desulfogranum japonicum]|uniref:flagellar hook-associated protein FlgL n=1 Tax=Desulfogranum japonicum TaxID=231447 RepID=UPI00041C6007|nr:flagellar hook-associated protein FlgL [Desulfogranum japonicum]
MIITRNASAYRTLQYNLSQNSTMLNELYVKTSTGVEVAQASDNPSVVGSIVSDRSELLKNDRYVSNCELVQDSLSMAETYMDSVEEIMTRAKEIAIYGANDSLSDTDRDTLAEEVSQLHQELRDLANTQIDGKYIFAGYEDETMPFTGDPVVYNGTSDHQMIAVGPNATAAKNVTGEELFMSPVNLFTTLDDLETALLTYDSTTISNQLTPLEEAAEQVRIQTSLLGNNSARMDDLISLHESASVQLEETLSRNQDADLTQVLSEITKMELSLEATMQVTARVGTLSLLDYL